jgi:DNA-binding IclR family transcriptional regulator
MDRAEGAVKSAARVVELLEAVARKPPGLTFTELLADTEIPRSSLHGLLRTLTDARVVDLDPDTKRYAPGPKLWELAMGYVNQLQLVPLAWPDLLALRDRFDETVQMGVLDAAEVVYVAQAPSSHRLQLVSHVGSRLPAYATGLGKALLAGLPEQAVQARVPADLSGFTPRTFTTRSALITELLAVRARGYATDVGEYSTEVRCVAAPVVDHTGRAVAAVSVTMAAERFLPERVAQVAPALIDTVRRVSGRLGGVDWDCWRRYPGA